MTATLLKKKKKKVQGSEKSNQTRWNATVEAKLMIIIKLKRN